MVELSKTTGIFQLAGIIFGSDDFCASLGATRTEGSQEIVYARQRLVLIAKAYDLQAIDMVHIDFKGTLRSLNWNFRGRLYGERIVFFKDPIKFEPRSI